MNTSFAPELDTPRARSLVMVPGRDRMTLAARNTSESSVSSGAVYEAGAQTRRTSGWRSPSITPNDAILGVLTTIRNRTREATRNNGYAKAVSDTFVSEMIGTGIKPLSKAEDNDFRSAVQVAWELWCDESDADGILDFYGQQAQATRAWFEGGEVFIRLRPRLLSDGLRVPLQLQVIEPELCPHTYNTVLPSGNRVRAGIEFNAIGRRVAYWFHPSRPGDLVDFDSSQLRRVPAEFVIHMFEPLRPGQLRGIPDLTQSLVLLKNIDKLIDAKLLRELLMNLWAVFIKPHAGDADNSVDPLTGLALDTSEDKPTITLEPGTIQELAAGEELQFASPPALDNNFNDFVRYELRAAMVGAGVPYEMVTGDLTGLNDRVVRVILNKFRRRLQRGQHQVVAFQFCRRVWTAWMDRGFVSGTLPLPSSYATDKAPWLASRWIPQGWPYIHPLQDVQAAEKRMRSGLTSRSGEVSELGEDAEQIDIEQQQDNTRADRLGLRYDSDGRQGKKAVAGPQRDPNADREEDPEADPEGEPAGAYV